MKSPRDAQVIDLAAYRRYGYTPKPTPRKVDHLKLWTWSLGIAFSLSVWVCLLLFAIWVRG